MDGIHNNFNGAMYNFPPCPLNPKNEIAREDVKCDA